MTEQQQVAYSAGAFAVMAAWSAEEMRTWCEQHPDTAPYFAAGVRDTNDHGRRAAARVSGTR